MTRITGLIGLGAVAACLIYAAISYPTQAPAQVPPRVKGARPFVDNLSRPDNRLWVVSDGWYNGSYMVNDWRASQVRFNRGLELSLALNLTDKAKYSSGEVQSRENFGHGYFESRMRAAPGSGVVTGFFTYTGPWFKKPWDEIDVEILGAKPREVMFTYFSDGKKVSVIHPVNYDATREEHVYGFDWQPGFIRWYIDGKLAHEATGEDIPLPRNQQKVMVSVWASSTLTSWVGPFDSAMLPVIARFTCLSYSPSYEARKSCT